MIKKGVFLSMSKKCDRWECKANDSQGICMISTCSLIDPQKAILEFENLIKSGFSKKVVLS